METSVLWAIKNKKKSDFLFLCARLSYHDSNSCTKASNGVLKPLCLHVGFSEENKKRGDRFAASGALKNFNGLKMNEVEKKSQHNPRKGENDCKKSDNVKMTVK